MLPCDSDDVAFALKDDKELPWLAKYLWFITPPPWCSIIYSQ